MDKLVKIIDKAAEDLEPAPPVEPQGDVIDLLYGGKPYVISASYGQRITWSCPGCYEYQLAYGLDTQHHYAYDVSAVAGDGAPLYAPFSGVIVCAGTDRGKGAWNTGCAAFGRLNNYGSPYPNGNGSGRIELLHDNGDASLIIGHALSCRVKAGDRVQAGDLIGTQGGMNGSHVHLEARYDGGSRIGDPRKLFKGGPVPVERVPYDLVNDPNLFTVKAIKAVKVYQRADPKAAVIDAIPAGDTFQAKAIVPGNDGKQWWLGARDGRVPMDGTELQ
jgi:murein DD-endopeptidase MepM/ murein hydrolase activator NlpD